jgi:hypothetical protein
MNAGVVKLGGHQCHARNCDTAVPPRMFMCRRHWYMLPKAKRDAVWATYRPGQEIDKCPSDIYMAVTRECIEYVAQREAVAS